MFFKLGIATTVFESLELLFWEKPGSYFESVLLCAICNCLRASGRIREECFCVVSLNTFSYRRKKMIHAKINFAFLPSCFWVSYVFRQVGPIPCIFILRVRRRKIRNLA